MSQFYDLVNIN